MTPLSVYVHLPFCMRKCHYCDFNSRPAPDAERRAYVDALRAEIECRAGILRAREVRTIFFGGGTPTIYEANELGEVLASLTAASAPRPPSVPERERAARLPDFEITCEANPETVDLPKLRMLREAGFNRLSIGAQSFDDEELRMLGRGHSADQAAEAMGAAREAGFDNVSLDLIYALPGQSVEAWRSTLRQALVLGPDHLSAYGLEIAAGTPLFTRYEAGEIAEVEDSAHLEMRAATGESCAEADLHRYEISNYARPGHECRHNITYWRNEPYLGLGAGAWSYLDGVRSANLREPREYVAAIEERFEALEYEEQLGPDEALAETLMMGLRMTDGLSLSQLTSRYGAERVTELLDKAHPLAEIGLLDLSDARMRLTAEGEMLHSEVCVRLV